MRVTRPLAALAAVLTLAVVAAAGPVADQVCAPYVAMLDPSDNERPCGAGTVIELNGEKLILTAAHVVEGEKGTELGDVRYFLTDTPGAAPQPAVLVAFSPPEDSRPPLACGHDLALLRPTRPAGLTAAKVAPKLLTLDRGEDVWYIGTPAGKIGHLERSILSRESKILGSTFYAINGCGWFGNSGGGAYVKRGESYFLIGVVCRIADPERWYKAPVYAQTQETIRDFLDGYKGKK